jgi:starch phosphorylase
MKPIRTFTVVPSIPPPLERLRDVARNLRWSWNPDAINLFRRLDSHLWDQSKHNPVLMLGLIDQQRLEELAHDEGFIIHLERVARDLDEYMNQVHVWFRHLHGQERPSEPNQPLVAYFSMEFGLTDCLSIFAGGLGLLAGDHLKSSSDLGVPLVAVGLLYQQGYFRQVLNEAGWQQENYEDNDFHNLPLVLERLADGAPLTVSVPFPGRDILAQVWRAQVGRVPLYLLDTNIDENSPDDRNITDQLYAGDLEMRIRQEIILGIGGVRALTALGLEPAVFHMNEGHSAFLALERVLQMMERHELSFHEAREAVSAGLIFTTHTPVPAGHDAFPPHMIDQYLTNYAQMLGLSRHDFLALGRENPDDDNSPFGMTVLALRLADYSNGVSKLHGEVSRQMWRGLWPGLPLNEIPIGHVTNGVHLRTWVSHELDEYYDRYLGPDWREEPVSPDTWQQVREIPDEELWRIHQRRRESLVVFARRRLRRQLERRSASRAEIDSAGQVLDPDILTIGFARRFATYKRATLLLRDPERLARIVNDPERPVQIIYAGKAHPRDDAGKEFIRQVVNLARQPAFRNRIIFLEDYDLEIARFMVQGCDVWLNNPRRPLEASGTSGMKAAANAGQNLSTLDGWWDEVWHAHAHSGSAVPIGWAIGRGEMYADNEYQDYVESQALYGLLEQEVVPTFYERGQDRLPHNWIARMKEATARLGAFISSHRMVAEYVDRFYMPASSRARILTADGCAIAKELAAWRSRVEEHWREVRVEAVESDGMSQAHVGDVIHGRALVRLGALAPKDVAVELYLGRLDASGNISDASAAPMRPARPTTDGSWEFEGAATCQVSGLHGYTFRARPFHPQLDGEQLPGLVTWANEGG